jgi:tetratricopeptide (TPR) repeat protein/NAD-dependent SIR2 family protein deacetylase
MLRNDLLKRIRRQKVAIFCGAGISYNSGLPIVTVLLDYLFDKLDLTTNQAKLITDSNLPFESIMEMVMNESTLEEIQEIFSAGEPNSNHILFAKLAKAGFIKTICTTNFDQLIEKAFKREGLVPDKDFYVYSGEVEFDQINWASDAIKLIKIHGCVSRKDQMAITMQLIASDQYAQQRKMAIEAIFKGEVCEEVLVMGYSCSDIDLSPLIDSFHRYKNDIFFIDHTPINNTEQERIEAVGLKKERNPFQDYTGNRIYVNTDAFTRGLWISLLNEPYSFTRSDNTPWQKNIDEWYSNAVEESGTGVKHHIASRLLYAVGAFKDAITHHKESIAIAMHDNNLMAYSAEMGNMGMAHDVLGEYEQAQFCFEEAIPLSKRIKNTQGLVSQLQGYANVLHHLKQNQKAIEMHKEALQYAEMDKDECGISNILGNMANAFNALGELESAIKCIERALPLSRKCGNKQSESSQLGTLAISLMLKGEFTRSLQHTAEGIKIKKSIGDLQGECQLLANSINLYTALGRKTEARQVIHECIALAQRIGNKEVERMAIMQLAIL